MCDAGQELLEVMFVMYGCCSIIEHDVETIMLELFEMYMLVNGVHECSEISRESSSRVAQGVYKVGG